MLSIRIFRIRVLRRPSEDLLIRLDNKAEQCVHNSGGWSYFPIYSSTEEGVFSTGNADCSDGDPFAHLNTDKTLLLHWDTVKFV
jgi:hypothetical protein